MPWSYRENSICVWVNPGLGWDHAVPLYLVDLLSAGADAVKRIPRPLLHQGIESGRIILDSEDPNFTLLILLGCDYTLLIDKTVIDSRPI